MVVYNKTTRYRDLYRTSVLNNTITWTAGTIQETENSILMWDADGNVARENAIIDITTTK